MMRAILILTTVLCGPLVFGSKSAQAGSMLYGITQASGNSTSLVSINETTGAATVVQSFALDSGLISIDNLTFFSPGNVFVTGVQRPNGVFQSIGIIDPVAGTFTEVELTGLSATENIAGIAFDPVANRLLATFGEALFDNRVLEFDLAGNILQATGDLGVFDRDNLAVHPVTGEIILEDVNDPPPGSMPGFVALTDPFGTPTTSTFADSPADSFSDLAISNTGRVLLARSNPNELAELNTGPATYTTIGSFGLGDRVVGLAYADLRVPEPKSLILAIIGTFVAILTMHRRVSGRSQSAVTN